MRFYQFAAAASLLGVSLSCAPLITRPTEYPPPPPAASVAASPERSFEAALAWFTEFNIPIRQTDRQSGLIVSELGGIPFRNQEALLIMKNAPMTAIYADCGTRNGVPYDPTATAWNVRITGDAAQSSVAATARYTESGEGVGNSFFVCSSTGKWEREIQAYIKQRAEAAK